MQQGVGNAPCVLQASACACGVPYVAQRAPLASDRLRQFLLLGQRYPLKVNINKTNSKRNKTRPDGICWTVGAAKGGGGKKAREEKLRA